MEERLSWVSRILTVWGGKMAANIQSDTSLWLHNKLGQWILQLFSIWTAISFHHSISVLKHSKLPHFNLANQDQIGYIWYTSTDSCGLPVKSNNHCVWPLSLLWFPLRYLEWLLDWRVYSITIESWHFEENQELLSGRISLSEGKIPRCVVNPTFNLGSSTPSKIETSPFFPPHRSKKSRAMATSARSNLGGSRCNEKYGIFNQMSRLH